MAMISEALAMAVEHHQAGRLQAVEKAYHEILQVEPQHADARHLLVKQECGYESGGH